VELVGILGSFSTVNSVSTWYATLTKPSFNPPGWIFGPVWTLLYLLIGISFYLIWTSKAKSELKTKAYIIFAIQIILNGIWSPIFFGMHQILLALIIIILMLVSITLNFIAFHRISEKASYLLLPYWLWVCFATLLNYSIFLLNK
jgi:benzodiazapine receptor